jgi:4-hydroxy-tetrahydrodipicolinate reductase
MGMCATREILRLPETELVAVLAYSKAKHGVDVGQLLGSELTGVRVTTDADELIAAKPEVVLQATHLFPEFPSDDEIIRLLEAGINVITCLPYQYPQARGADVAKRFDEAGKRGGATLFGTGENPGFMFERLAATMTGISNDIQCIRVDEYFSCQHLTNGKEILPLYGFGTPVEEVEKNETSGILVGHYLTGPIHYMADKLGVPLDRIERTSHHKVVTEDITIPGVITARKGTVGTLSFKFTGYSNGRPMFVNRTRLYLHESLRPREAKGDDYWIIQIEGQPSTRLGLEITGSLKRNLPRLPNNPAPGGYFATVIPMIQAIPMVIDAAPGLHVTAMPEVHWKPDMRN